MSTELPRVSESNEPLSAVRASLIVAEFNALKAEIQNRSDKEIQYSTLAILALGTLFTAGLASKSAAVILTYPLLATGLATGWAAQDAGIQLAGSYIRSIIEPQRAGLSNMSWEHFLQLIPGFKNKFRRSAWLIFVASELASLIVGGSLSNGLRIVDVLTSGQLILKGWTVNDLMFILGVVSVFTTGIALWRFEVRKKDVDKAIKELSKVVR